MKVNYKEKYFTIWYHHKDAITMGMNSFIQINAIDEETAIKLFSDLKPDSVIELIQDGLSI